MTHEPPSGPDGGDAGVPDAELVEVVMTAATLDDAAREHYLAELAGRRPALADAARRRIDAARDLPDTFLNVSAPERLGDAGDTGNAPVHSETAPAGSPEDRYELGECLGEGGMGRVVTAYDRQLRRRVALKFLTHNDPEVLHLFMQEARAQARIRHPNVLDIYDSGLLDGKPYISMHLASAGSLAGIGASLPLEQKVRLVMQAAEGLHAAHRAGLVHRDVKPSNILADETPDGELTALVADFGLASDLADTDGAAGADVAGSPRYIAPERLAGQVRAVDRRSDIYSLGVTMYWLFSGVEPFGDDNTVRILERVRRAELPRPRTHLPQLPAEIEAVIMRCIAANPEDRYPSARAVAADLQRYLEGEVVDAYAAGIAYRLTRFVLRNKLLAVLSGVLAASLVLASATVTVFALYADAARERAELRQRQAEELIRFMVTDLNAKLDSLGRLDIMNDIGDAATEYFAAVPEESLSDAELLRRSQMLHQIGQARVGQGDLDGAVEPMEQSLALAARLAELRPDDSERLFALGQSHFWLGYVHWKQGDLDTARTQFEAYRDVSRTLVSRDPDNLDWQRELAYAHSNLGSLLQAEGDLVGAVAQFNAALVVDQRLVTATESGRADVFELAATHNLLGVVYLDLGRMDAARAHLAADLAIRQELLDADPGNHRNRDFLAVSHSYMGIHDSVLGDWTSAREHFEHAHVIHAALVDHDPANTSWRFKLAWSHINLGRAALANGRMADAGLYFTQARVLVDDLLALDSPHAWRRTDAIVNYHLALIDRGHARHEAARDGLRHARDVLERLSASRPDDRSVHRWLALVYLALGSLEEVPAHARTAFRHAADTIRPFIGVGRDARMLAPWTIALRCLGREPELAVPEAAPAAHGYTEPGLGPVCGLQL